MAYAAEPVSGPPRSARTGSIVSHPTDIAGSRSPTPRDTSGGAESPCLKISSKKEERARQARFKPDRFEAPRAYEEEELQEELAPLASEAFRRGPRTYVVIHSGIYMLAILRDGALISRKLLFSKDFKKHIEAADVLLGQLDDVGEAVISCLDLLLRWLVYRICDANTQCLLKVLHLTKALFALCASSVRPWLCPPDFLSAELSWLSGQKPDFKPFACMQGIQLSDAEAQSFLPCLVEKAGHNQVATTMCCCRCLGN